MQLRLRVTHPFEQELPVDVRNVTVEERLDCTRASHADGVVTIDHTFGPQNVVPDVDRYRLHRAGNRFVLCGHAIRAVSAEFNRYCDIPPAHPHLEYSKTVVVILESPHKEEFRCNVGRPIAPAQGRTGARIRNHLGRVLQSCDALYGELEEGTRIVLANPVQFQTSLVSVVRCPGFEWKKVRTSVWKALWNYRPPTNHPNNGGQTTDASYPTRVDFKERLIALAPDHIVNACTSPLKLCVRDFLERSFSDVARYEAHHPSVWGSPTQLRSIRP